MLVQGTIICMEGEKYLLQKLLTKGADSEVFIVEDISNAKKYILKAFTEKKKASPKTNRGYYNHYGKTRDVHRDIFSEIQGKSLQYGFLVKHIKSLKYYYNNQADIQTWRWLLLQEYVEGVVMLKFIEDNYLININSVEDAIIMLGQTLKEWHKNEFAHGDPHLGNAIVQIDNGNPIGVKLIDYSQIHHPSFAWCKKCECYPQNNPQKRFEEDLENSYRIGKGFLKELQKLQLRLKISNSMFEIAFRKGYY